MPRDFYKNFAIYGVTKNFWSKPRRPLLSIRRHKEETLWLNLNQIAGLFERDKFVISRHLSNIYKTGEQDGGNCCIFCIGSKLRDLNNSYKNKTIVDKRKLKLYLPFSDSINLMEKHTMRPIASEQDPLRYPLNEIFGTQAHVRVLRVMAVEVEGPLTASDIAKRTGLTVPGAQKSLGKLLRSGFISRVGGGRKHQYEIRRSDRLMQVAIELFQSEKNRYEHLLSAIKNEIKNLTPSPHATWIQAIPREIDEPLKLGLLHETLYLTECANYLRTGLDGIEKDFDLTIELEGYTKADIPDLELDGITILYGVVPNKPTDSTKQRAKKVMTHRQKDAQLKQLSRKLADIIQQDASIVRRAKDYIDSLLKEEQGAAAGDLMEWRNILDTYSIQRLVRFVMSSSERAKRLRQSNPFFAILNTAERLKLAAELGEQV